MYIASSFVNRYGSQEGTCHLLSYEYGILCSKIPKANGSMLSYNLDQGQGSENNAANGNIYVLILKVTVYFTVRREMYLNSVTGTT